MPRDRLDDGMGIVEGRKANKVVKGVQTTLLSSSNVNLRGALDTWFESFSRVLSLGQLDPPVGLAMNGVFCR